MQKEKKWGKKCLEIMSNYVHYRLKGKGVSYFAKTLALQSLAGIESLRFCGLPAEGAGLSKAY